jgi:hypothetical protein
MKGAVEMGSAAMIYIQNFIKIGSGIPKLRGEIHTHIQTARRSHKPKYIFAK